MIDHPQGVYYGGTVAAPVMKEIFENVLPYLGIEKVQTEATDANEEGIDVELILRLPNKSKRRMILIKL